MIPPRQRVLVTGATGLVGGALVQRLSERGAEVIATTRAVSKSNIIDVSDGPLKLALVGNIDAHTSWEMALEGVDVVVHCAAITRIPRSAGENLKEIFAATNVDGTLRLASEALNAGVKRLIYISSIKVNGEHTPEGRPFTEKDPPSPACAYGWSKALAEERLLELTANSNMDVVLVRPPLIVGRKLDGNLWRLARLLALGAPLPFGGVDNRRSMVSLENLVDLIALLSNLEDSPRASNQIFLISDGEDISIDTLLRKIAKAADLPCRLFPLPRSILSTVINFMTDPQTERSLLGNLQLDSSKVRELLGWRPPISLDDQLKLVFRSQEPSSS